MRLLLALILSLFTCSVWALTPVKVVLDWYINPDHAPLLIAEANGYFQQQGLDVSLLPPGNVDPSVLVATGKADIAISYQPYLLMQVDQGLPVMRFASLVAQPLSCVAVLKSTGITQLNQLAGKEVAYSGSSLSGALFGTMLQHVGSNISQVQMINVNMDLIQALLSHRVAATVDLMRNVEPIQMQLMGYPTTLFLPEEHGVPSYDELIFVVKNTRADDPILPKFVMAIDQAAKFIKANPEKSWQIASKAYPNELAPTSSMSNINHAIWMASVSYFNDDIGVYDAERYDNFANYMLEEKLIHKKPELLTYSEEIP
jgi:putative hydroxymethylpyrimidine transport system substrate-binding protein